MPKRGRGGNKKEGGRGGKKRKTLKDGGSRTNYESFENTQNGSTISNATIFVRYYFFACMDWGK